MTPRLSIVIPSHARVDLLTDCLQSVLRYSPTETEIIVIDDGSQAGSVTACAQRFAGVRVERLPSPSGFCAACNRGIALAQGDVVELLNDDTVVTPGWAESALACFADPQIGAVAPLVYCWPSSEQDRVQPKIDSAGDRYYQGGVAAKHKHGQRSQPGTEQPRYVFGTSGAAGFYRREALRTVGSFPEHFRAYFEDVDLAFRLQRAGYRTRFEPTCVVWHHVSASHGSTKRSLLAQQACNEERVFWRNVPWSALPAALPRHLAVLLGKAWLRWQEGRLVPFFWGKLRAWSEWRQIRTHRAELAALGDARSWFAWGVEPNYWRHETHTSSQASAKSGLVA